MKKHRLLVLTAVLGTGLSIPAFAAWDRIGSVDVSYRLDRDTQYGNFGGSVESLSFRADDSDVTCRNVRATFGNGQTRDIFHGNLPRGRNVTVNLPGKDRMIRRIDFTCHASSRRGATINIAADVGRYRDEWRHSSDWGNRWSRMFHWDNDHDHRDDHHR